jgi:nicotinamidase-related amidase
MTDLIVGRPALLLIDMQHDFIDAESGCYAKGAERVVPTVASLAAICRAVGVPVIHTRELHRPGGVDSGRELDSGPGTLTAGPGEPAVPWHTIRGTKGAEIVPELTPVAGDHIVDKARFSCFLGTDLDFLLGGLEISTLFVAGVCTDVCVLWTVGDAFQRDYYVRVIEDCTAGSAVDRHEAALLIMRSFTHDGHVVASAEVIEAMRALG